MDNHCKVDDIYCKLREKFFEIDRLNTEIEKKHKELNSLGEPLKLHFYGDDVYKHKIQIMEHFFEDEVRKINKNVQLRNYSGELNVENSEIKNNAQTLSFEKLMPLIQKYQGEEDNIKSKLISGFFYNRYIEGSCKNGRIKIKRYDPEFARFLNVFIDGKDARTAGDTSPHIKDYSTYKNTADVVFHDKSLARKVFIGINYGERSRW